MFCSNCGTENPETSSFCSKCGAKINSQTSEPTQPNGEFIKSKLTTVGAVLALVSLIISICPLAISGFVGNYQLTLPDNNPSVMSLGHNMVNTALIRLGFVLLAIVFSSISLATDKPLKIISIALLLSVILAILLPFIFGTDQSVITINVFSGVFLLVL